MTEIEICGSVGEESNALFSGVKAVEKELQELADAVCPEPVKLSPVHVKASGSDNVRFLFDGNLETRWSTNDTRNDNDLDNGKVTMRFLGDQRVSHVKIAFFNGELAFAHFRLYTQKATDSTWSNVFTNDTIAAREHTLQQFDIEKGGVNKLYIVGKGNDVGAYTKISEIEVWGC